ncbi:E3 ubiquitin-protein ligase rnf5 [Tilletia horrida]|nr:E3 ubiquitin-protein ligase rnf5 [Tilletia horrida]KAK0553251.1 E3 ubiquitin-protein ligase rnf5 [Tilletia horrida]
MPPSRSNRSNPAQSAARKIYTLASEGSREVITLCDSSDEDEYEELPRAALSAGVSKRAAKACAARTASSDCSKARCESSPPPESGRRRSARQASKAVQKLQAKDLNLISPPSSSRSASSSSRHSTPSPVSSPRRKSSKSKGKETAKSSSNNAASSAVANAAPSASSITAAAALAAAASAAAEVELRRRDEEDQLRRQVQELRASQTTLRAQVSTLEASTTRLNEKVASLTQMSSKVEDYLTCGICMDVHLRPFTMEPCGHNCCIRCLHPWLAEHKTCPLCAVAVSRAFPNSDMHALSQAFVEAHPEKAHSEDDKNEAETLLMLAKESSPTANFAQLLPHHARQAKENNLGPNPLFLDEYLQHARLPAPNYGALGLAPQHAIGGLDLPRPQGQAQLQAPAAGAVAGAPALRVAGLGLPPARPAQAAQPEREEPPARIGSGGGLFHLNFLLGR